MGLIEKVARAICKADRFDPDEISKSWMPGKAYWTGYVPLAKAAIQAIIDSDWPESISIEGMTYDGEVAQEAEYVAKAMLQKTLTG